MFRGTEVMRSRGNAEFFSTSNFKLNQLSFENMKLNQIQVKYFKSEFKFGLNLN